MSHALDSVESLAFADTALADTFLAEQELAELNRAELANADAAVTFDPLGLYQLEQDRDVALSFLAASLPADAFFRLSHSTATQRYDGRFATENEWRASALPAGETGADHVVMSRTHATPAEAARELVTLWNARHATPAERPADRDETRVNPIAYGRFQASAKVAGGRWTPAGYHSYATAAAAQQAADPKLAELRRDAKRTA